MEHELIAVPNVMTLQDAGKQWLESVLGHPLRENQRLFIMAVTPGVEPDAEAKHKGFADFERITGRVGLNLQTKGISEEQFDAAVDEAMEHVRRRDG